MSELVNETINYLEFESVNFKKSDLHKQQLFVLNPAQH